MDSDIQFRARQATVSWVVPVGTDLPAHRSSAQLPASADRSSCRAAARGAAAHRSDQAASHYGSAVGAHRGTDGSNPLSSSGESHAEPEHRGKPLLRRFAICDPKWPPTRPQRGHIAPSPVSSRNEAVSGGGRLLRATTVSGPSRHRSPPRRPAQGRNATGVSDARLTDNVCRSPTRCLMAAPRRRRRRRHRAQGRTTKCLHFIRGLVRVGARVGDS
jgi:hypothetical protein